jgi:HPt (histidine-containing phosphotransfer) domain-containing protein
MNFDKFCEMLDLDREMGMEMLDLFYETSIADLARIESGLKGGLARDVAEGAHSIKGAARNLEIDGIYQLAADLETKAQRNQLGDGEPALSLLRDRLALLSAKLRENDLENLDI